MIESEKLNIDIFDEKYSNQDFIVYKKNNDLHYELRSLANNVLTKIFECE